MDKRERNNIMLEKNPAFQFFSIETNWIDDKEKRLDASYYAKDVIASKILIEKLEKKGIPIGKINDFSRHIFWPGRFKRRYASKKNGKPFLMPSEVMMLLPKPRKFVLNYPDNVKVNKNWLLITRSGSVGKCLIVTSFLEDSVLSDDLIRIIPKSERNVGYLYVYLNTWIGQAFLIKDQYGMTVKHIEPHHVATISVPCVPKLNTKINAKIQTVQKLREEAQKLILKAEEMIHAELGLPQIEEDNVEYFEGEKGRIIKSFIINASDLNIRLDASYHIPIIRLIHKILERGEKTGKYKLAKIGDLAKVFDLPTYKRVYVRKDEGSPIVSGANLRQIKLNDLKYISPISFFKSGKNILNKYKIKKGWILVTERGTTGISTYITKRWDNWLASHNILRVIPKKIKNGYLLGFLKSEYAQYQLKSKELGAVVEVLDPPDLEDVIIPVPTEKEIEEKIHNLVIQAYNKKDEANEIEEAVVKSFENKLVELAEEDNFSMKS